MPVSTNVDDRSGQPVVDYANQNPKPNKKEPKIERDDPLCSEIPEWLQEFRGNSVDDDIPKQGDSHVSSSHEASLEPIFKRREDLGEHSVYTHFPKDRNCEICQRTKITRAPCRRRNGGAEPRAEKFGDLITADHKLLRESYESRNNHRYAIVVQDVATQWFQSYPCKTKTPQETERSLARRMRSPMHELNNPRGSRTCVCAITFFGWGGTRKGGKGELTSCRGTVVKSAWQTPPVRRKGGTTGLPARASCRHVARG